MLEALVSGIGKGGIFGVGTFCVLCFRLIWITSANLKRKFGNSLLINN